MRRSFAGEATVRDARVAMNAGRDDAALSSAPTPVRDSPGASALRLARGTGSNGSGRKSQPGVPGRTSLLQGQPDKSSDLASALPRRFSGRQYPSGGQIHRPLASRSVGGLPMMVTDKPTMSSHENVEAQARDNLGDQRRSIGGPLLSRAPRASPSQTPEKSPFTSPINSPHSGGLLSLGVSYPAIPQHNLFWASVRQEPPMTTNEHWFSTDRVLVYSAFCADFGPMNLSCIHRFIKILREKLEQPELKGKKLVYFTGASPQQRTNAAFLLGCYMVVEMKMSPEEAWVPFAGFSPSPFMGYRDATFVRSTWDLAILDCWRGLKKGMDVGHISFNNFNPDEYDYYDHPQHGDMHVIVPGKFIAFKGPAGRRYRLAPGLFSHTPKDYVEVFRHHKVSAVVRLNSKEYDRGEFLKHGFNHYDLFFEDCTTPTESLVNRFLEVSRKENGVVAVHCLAGLGRTGTLIALWMMREHGYTATEVIAYLRIVRPGSVIGPQQQYLCNTYARMVASGSHGVPYSESQAPSSSAADAELLAREVKEGMLRRHINRLPSNTPGNATNGWAGHH